MVGKLKQFARNTWVLKGLVGWRALFQFSKSNLGLEVCTQDHGFEVGRILVLAPHPDDEIFGCGGTLRRHILSGCKVSVLYLHNGSLGNPTGVMDPAMVPVRQAESKAALKALGGGDAEFWNYRDGELPLSQDTANKLKKIISDQVPVRIYVPWIGDNHFDHDRTWRLLAIVLRDLNFQGQVWQYEVWAPLVPNRLVPLGEVIEEKIAAIRCFPSQSVSTDYESGILGLNRYRGSMAGLNEPAEAFFATNASDFLALAQAIG